MCFEILHISRQGRLILDQSNPTQLMVDETLWARVPEEVKNAIVQCAQLSRPAELRNGPMRVVEIANRAEIGS
jgi:hypothetical protein